MTHNLHKLQNAASGSTSAPAPHAGRRVALLLGQLRERKVCRAAIAYILVTWLVLQLGEILFPALNLPDWTLTLIVVLAVLEFPVAMLLAWLFQWTPDGIRIDAAQSGSSAPPGRFDCALNLALLLAAALLSLQLAWPPAEAGTANADEPPVTLVVLPFVTPAGGSFGLEQEIRHQLLQSPARPGVVFARDARDAGAANLAIEGTVYEHEGTLRLLVQLIDLPGRTYQGSIAIDAFAATSQHAREKLARRVVEAVLDGALSAVAHERDADEPASAAVSVAPAEIAARL